MARFTADVYQNEYLPVGGSEVNAIVTVSSSGSDGTESQPAAAEIVIVDTSGSMDVPKVKINSARDATSVAIDHIRDGVAFAVMPERFARVAFPSDGGLAIASPRRAWPTGQPHGWRPEAARVGTGWTWRALFETVPGRTATPFC